MIGIERHSHFPSLPRVHAKHHLWLPRYRIPSVRTLRQAVLVRHGRFCPLRTVNALIELK
jgi:hypothetical protein